MERNDCLESIEAFMRTRKQKMVSLKGKAKEAFDTIQGKSTGGKHNPREVQAQKTRNPQVDLKDQSFSKAKC